jgi:hypothetical protein
MIQVATDAVYDLARHQAENLAHGHRALIERTPPADRPALLKQLRQQLKQDLHQVQDSSALNMRNMCTRVLSLFNDRIREIAADS